jgi:hypothetical protein
MNPYCLGLDLGQAADFSALAVLEKSEDEQRVRRYRCRALKQWPLHTSYLEIIDDIERAILKPPLQVDSGERLSLVIDTGGPGRPVVDMIRARKMPAKIIPVTITGGATESYTDGYWNVAKIILIGHLQVLLQSRRLEFVPGIPKAAILIEELQHYRVKITEKANETFNAREGQHDDLVLALALAVWIGEYRNRRLNIWM